MPNGVSRPCYAAAPDDGADIDLPERQLLKVT